VFVEFCRLSIDDGSLVLLREESDEELELP